MVECLSQGPCMLTWSPIHEFIHQLRHSIHAPHTDVPRVAGTKDRWQDCFLATWAATSVGHELQTQHTHRACSWSFDLHVEDGGDQFWCSLRCWSRLPGCRSPGKALSTPAATAAAVHGVVPTHMSRGGAGVQNQVLKAPLVMAQVLGGAGPAIAGGSDVPETQTEHKRQHTAWHRCWEGAGPAIAGESAV